MIREKKLTEIFSIGNVSKNSNSDKVPLQIPKILQKPERIEEIEPISK